MSNRIPPARNAPITGMEALESRTLLTATWTKLAHTSPNAIGTMNLLSDGSVIVADNGNHWSRLIPDATGSYVNGTWQDLAPSHDTREYDSTQLLQDGRLFVAGGEYGTGTATGEIYDPVRNIWTQVPAQPFGNFEDSSSMLLPDGRVLITPVQPVPLGSTAIYDPATNTWSQGPQLYRGDNADEQSLVKLPDNSILTIDGNDTAERYIPSLNQWINDAPPPVDAFSSILEIGAAVLLTDGRALYFGGTGHTLLYTPSGSTAPGSWTTGVDIPNGLGESDAPAAVLRDGTVLDAAGPVDNYDGPTSLYIYDPVANTYTAATGAPTINIGPYATRMLTLPNGDLLFNDGTSIYEFNPGTAPQAIAKPTIQSIAAVGNGSFTLTGTLLNGLNAGSAYGDDAQMDTNYPIVRLTSGSNVFYARTSHWSSTGVATGSTPETTNFILPLGIAPGTYSLSLVANGIASDSVPLTISTTANNTTPTVATGAAASMAANGLTAALSVMGADDAGESNLTYTWTATSTSTTTPLPSYSVNRSNGAKGVTATFYAPGTYTFTVYITDAGGLSTSSQITITVPQIRTSLSIAPAVSGVVAGISKQLTGTMLDQFGNVILSPGLTWSVLSGSGTVDSSGRYVSPQFGTLAKIQATDGTLTATALVGVIDKPWNQRDIGAPTASGAAYDDGTTFTVIGAGDIGGTADQFHAATQTMTGDGALTARVVTQQSNDPNAKAGLMIRASTAAGDLMVFEGVTPAGTTFISRTTNGGVATAATTAGPVAPYWIRLVRVGSTITGFRSVDGVNWMVDGKVTIPFASSLSISLAVSSNNSAVLTTSAFDHISINQTSLATIVNRAVFYNNSSYDGNDASANAAKDNAAIATDKQALLPGQTATSVNFTDYTRGINGVILDIANLPSASALSASDFTFKAGTTTDPTTWVTASAPTVSIFRGAGVNGSDRVELIWPDATIRNEWLQVTVNASAANTGLASADVFYFGNLVGDTGDAAGAASAIANSADVLAERARNQVTQPITSWFDFNRDGIANTSDVLLSRANDQQSLLTITAPPTTGPAAKATSLRKAAATPSAPQVIRNIVSVQAPTAKDKTLLFANQAKSILR